MTGARPKIILAAGLLIGAAAIGLTLFGSPLAVARITTSQQELLARTNHKLTACQAGETIARRTSAIRLRTYAFLGPRVTVAANAGGREIAHGERGPGWTGGVVTMPIGGLSGGAADVELCFTLFLNGEESELLFGEPTSAARAALVTQGPQRGLLPGRLRVEYLHPAASSWWSLASSVARRMGLGRAWPGAWVALLVVALMSGVAFVCARTILRELGRELG